MPWTYGLAYLGVVVGENWEQVLAYFDLPTLLIAGALIVIAGIWYLRRRKQSKAPAETKAAD